MPSPGSLPASARAALAEVEARLSAVHKLVALAVIAAVPLIFAGWLSWSTAQQNMGNVRAKVEALAVVDSVWRTMAAVAEQSQDETLRARSLDPILADVKSAAAAQRETPELAHHAAAWADAVSRGGVERAQAVQTGADLLAEISSSAELTVSRDRSSAWALYTTTRQLPLFLAALEHSRAAINSGGGDRELWKTSGAYEDTAKRTIFVVGQLRRYLSPAQAARLARNADKLTYVARDVIAKLDALAADSDDPAARETLNLAEQEAAYAVDALYRDVSAAAHETLQERLDAFSARRRAFAVLALFLLTATGLIALAIARSIVKPQRRLAYTMERLVEGDTTIEIPYRGYRHEVGDFARAVEVFRQTLIARKTLEHRIESERAALEKRVAERTRALEAANAEKSRFVALLSHEIRTPLNGVLGMASALARTPLDAHQQDMLRVVTASGDVLLRLLNNAIDITRIEAGQFELELGVFDISEIVEAAAALYREDARAKGLAFSVTIAPDAAGSYRGDGVRVRQIVQNFVANAVKFTEEGAVSVSVARIGMRDGRTLLRLDVADTGIGLPADSGRLFQRFAQGEASFARRYGGAGLGLAICRELADLMDATVSAHPNSDRGATFRLDIPLESAAAPAPAISGVGPEERDVWAGLRILAADDNAMNRLVLKTLLAQAGIDVHVVENGVDAVEAARAVRFDVILLDLHMPGLDGVTAARTIRVLGGPNKHAPILALTADTLPTQIEACFKAGMNGHVAKPIQVEALFGALTEALARTGQTAQASAAAN
jgi:signal transduction histidine kinase/AmiR/NasT family two-component response regulator